MTVRKDHALRGDMTVGSPLKKILWFAVPLFIGNIFQQVYNLADTAIAGYTLGDNAIAAIGATSSLYSLLVDFASGMNSGFGIVTAQSFGAKNWGKVRRSIAAMLVLNLALAAVLTAGSLVALRPLMAAMEVPAAIFEDAYAYIFVIFAGLLATVCYNMFAGILRAFGNSRTPLYVLVAACVVNLVLDVLFMVQFQWGVAGAAAATVIAQAFSAVLCGLYLWRVYPHLLPRRGDFRLEGPLVKEMWSTGSAMALMLCVVDLGSVLYQKGINGLGQQLIVAHTAARKLIGMLMMPLGSVATAYSTFVGQNFGAGKMERIRSTMKKVMGLQIAWGLLSCAVIFLLGSGLVVLLTDTEDAAVVENAVFSLRCHFACFPVLGVLLAFRTAMQAMGQKLIPVVSSGFELFIKVAAGLWLIPLYGYVVACVAEPVIWILSTAFLLISYGIKQPLKQREEQDAPDGRRFIREGEAV